jgi:hypothetical protein
VQLGKVQEAKFACQKGLQLDPGDQQMKALLQQVNQLEMMQKAKDYEEAEKRKKEEEAAAVLRKQLEEAKAAQDAIVVAGMPLLFSRFCSLLVSSSVFLSLFITFEHSYYCLLASPFFVVDCL